MTSNKSHDVSLAPQSFLPPMNGTPRNLSRSPHPYHRRSSSLQNGQQSGVQAQVRYSGSSDSTESEERATEADDEKGPILKGLPAPPLRGRKGLRGSKTPIDLTPAISPFPTPPAFTHGRSSYFVEQKEKKHSTLDEDEERVVEAYKQHVKRRRAEVARRCTEASLLALIGAAACREAYQSNRLAKIAHQLITSVSLLIFLYLLFPVRIAWKRFRGGSGLFAAIKSGFHIPSRFDPGPLMYPVLLPFFISVSLDGVQPVILITNVVLGLSSLPSKVIPFDSSQSAEFLHWIISVIPAMAGSVLSSNREIDSQRQYQQQAELLVLLHPLHHALLVTLKFLTSTSLDPAEIQLLSSGLINLYLFASSPQAEILKALLWVGALCLFIFCQIPLGWEVRLARIPSWKFARNKSPRSGLFAITENVLNTLLPQHRYKPLGRQDSDDEDYEHLKSARRMVKNSVRLRKTRTNGFHSDFEPMGSRATKEWNDISPNGLQRSLTVSPIATNLPPLTNLRRKNSLNQSSTGFLSLTYVQAQACKWLISAYVLSVVAIVILVVVRNYVSTRALSSHEPFGWAIGYLFGNIRPLRLWIVSNNMETWIALPSHIVHNAVYDGFGLVESFRQTQLGPANMRLLIAAYCLVVLTLGIGLVLQLGTVTEVDTRRKVFHGIMVAMLLPTIFVDPCFIALALALILAIFLLLDLFRASQLPPISKPLTSFLAPYVDGRDYRGPIVVSHMFLLIGCAMPLWLSLAAASRAGEDPWLGWDTNVRELSMISGVVCVGLGDAAASLIGRRYGRTKWFWGGGKSLEGSMAFAVAVTIGLAASYMWMRLGGWIDGKYNAFPVALFKMALAGTGASLLETVLTAGNDNVIVPIGLWLLTRGLDI